MSADNNTVAYWTVVSYEREETPPSTDPFAEPGRVVNRRITEKALWTEAAQLAGELNADRAGDGTPIAYGVVPVMTLRIQAEPLP